MAARAADVFQSSTASVATPLTLEAAQTPLSRASHTSIESAASQPACILDLELMSNVMMGGLLDVLPAMQDSSGLLSNFIQLALATPYLLHELLAVSALHLYAEHGSREELVLRASYHQKEALSLVQPDITSIPEERALPLLFFSSFAAVSALAEAAFDPRRHHDFDPIAKTTHAFQLSRGIMAMLTPHWSYIRKTWAGPVIRSEIEAGSDLTPSPQDIPTYTILRSLAFGVEPNHKRKACLEAVDITLSSLSLLQQSDDASLSRRLATAWPIECDAAFHSLLAESKPVSLIILAHYAALLKLGTGLWWTGSLPGMLLGSIDHVLGEEWAEFLDWPKSIVLDDRG